jgi:hypothetical protein
VSEDDAELLRQVEEMATFAAIWLAGLSEGGRTPAQAMQVAALGWTTVTGAPAMMFYDLLSVAAGRLLARDVVLRWLHVVVKPA